MGRLSKKDMEELREFCSLGCDYSVTKEIVSEITSETLEELGSELLSADEFSLFDGDTQLCGLDDFINIFWKKAVEKIMNVVETLGK